MNCFVQLSLVARTHVTPPLVWLRSLCIIRFRMLRTHLGRVRLGSIRNKNSWNNANKRSIESYSHSSLLRSRYLSRHATLLPTALLTSEPHSFADISQSQLGCHFQNPFAPNSPFETRPIRDRFLSLHRYGHHGEKYHKSRWRCLKKLSI